GAQALRETEKRPAVAGVACQIISVDALGVGGAPELEQDRTETLTHGVVPGRRLGEPVRVLLGDGRAQEALGRRAVARLRRNLTGEYVGRELQHVLRLEEERDTPIRRHRGEDRLELTELSARVGRLPLGVEGQAARVMPDAPRVRPLARRRR